MSERTIFAEHFVGIFRLWLAELGDALKALLHPRVQTARRLYLEACAV